MTTTLTEHLRGLPDEQLAALLRRRPDLVVPVPGDLSALAVRAQSRMSVGRAVDSLDRFTLEILDGARLSRDEEGRTSLRALRELATGVPPERVREAVALLRDLVLVFGPDHALRVVGTVDEVCSPYPAGLGRPAAELGDEVAARCADAVGLRRTVLAAPAPARAVLDRLAAGPPIGAVTSTVPPGATGPGTGTAGAVPPPGSTPAPLAGAVSPPGSTAAPLAGYPSRPARAVPPVEPSPPVRWLVDHHLLVPIGSGLMELPREVGVLLRRTAHTGPLGRLHPEPPPIPGPDGSAGAAGTPGGMVAAPRPRNGGRAPGAPTRFDLKAADSAGAGQAFEAIRQVEALLDALSVEAPAVLRAGGIGVRDLRRLARTADVTEPVAALLLEVAAAAGLLGENEAGASPPAYLPTVRYDEWRAEPLAVRWTELVAAWLTMTRQPGLVGARGERDRLYAALSPDVERTNAPVPRRAALGVLASVEPGTAATATEILAVLAWQAPRRFPVDGRTGQVDGAGQPGRPSARAEAVRSALAEAATLGLSGMSALTSYGRLLLAEVTGAAEPDGPGDPLGVRGAGRGPASAAAVLDGLLPAPVDHLLIQADLTMVVPGPPEPAFGTELDLIADRESAGGASVYRVTPESVRRALDAGYSAADLHRLFASRSRTPIPQALTYLVDDVARRHGGLRVGAAASYLRAEDEALLSELLADRRFDGLGLRRLAPTVLITPFHPTRLLTVLRENGYAPAQEDPDGMAIVARPRARRTTTPTGAGRPGGRVTVLSADPFAPGPRLSPARLSAIVDQLRRGDQAARVARRSPVALRAVGGGADPDAHAQALAALQQAIRDRQRVWVGYVDAHGGAASRLVRPVSIGAGYLRAEDERSETVHTFRLERITTVVPDTAPSLDPS